MNDSQKLYEFRKMLKRLGEFRGSGTELISVYVPSGSPLHETANKLREEMSQASNIKSKSTKTNVIGALERILNHFKIYKSTPSGGLAVFAGNVSDNASKVDIELFSSEPIQPLTVGIYRCDNKFFLEPLERMVEKQDKYGIVVMDGREATIAIVKGTQIQIVKKMNSTAHQKVTKGGQCLSPESLIQKEDGEILEIKELMEGDKILSADLNEHAIRESFCCDIFRTNSKSYRIIKTYAPAMRIEATPYHRFLIIGQYGIREKYAKDLNNKDRLLAVRKINHKGRKVQIVQSTIHYATRTKNCWLPRYFEEELAYFLGVVCGDGTLDGNRIIIYEGKQELVEKYVRKFEKLFRIQPVIKQVDKTHQKGSFAKKPYFEIRLYSLKLVDFILDQCKEIIKKTEERDIPVSILKSENSVGAAFLKGLFDAEGYIHKRIVGIAGISKKLIQKCQLLLLRYGVLSSFREKKAKKNPQWCLTITDADSLCNFKKYIGFVRSDKAKHLAKICGENKKSQQYSNQIPIHGRYVYQLIKNTGLRSRDFKCPDFFTGKKAMGRTIFKKNILDRLRSMKSKEGVKKVYDILHKVYAGHMTTTVLSKNIAIKKKGEFYDITVPETANFMANGLLVHNSQRRYQRLVEESIELYYKRVGEAMDEYFVDNTKGVIVGGPGPTKDFFMKMSPFNYQIKVLGVVDTGYTDEYGIREVLAKSESILAEQEAVKEKIIIDRFIKEVANSGLATYGEAAVKNAIISNQASKILLSEGLEHKRAVYACVCGSKTEKLVKDKPTERFTCASCGQEAKLEMQLPLIEELTELAQSHNIEVHIISENTAEGLQFLKGFGGLGAFLRYR